MGHNVTLNHNTLQTLANSGRKMGAFNATKGWLTKSEEDMAIQYAAELGERGFPLTYHCLKEHVDEICHVCLGDKFLIGGVGCSVFLKSMLMLYPHIDPGALTQNAVVQLI